MSPRFPLFLLLVWALVPVACEEGPRSPPAVELHPEPGTDGGDAHPTPVPPPTMTVRARVGGAEEQAVEAIVYGDPFRVVVEHLAPGTLVTVKAHKRDLLSPGLAWEARARFEVPADGVVDTAALPSLAGTYEGVDGDGLVWSMAQVSAPPGLGTAPYTLYLMAETEEEAPLAQAELRQLAVPADVERVTVHTEDGLVGVLYLPASKTPRSPVLTLGGSEGGLFGADWLASIAASQGHPALGLAYFGAPGLPSALESIPLEYVGRALRWLQQHPKLDASRIAVMGASRGAELALLVAAHHPEVTAVVAWEPSAYVWGSVAGDQPAWTWGGAPLPRVPSSPQATPGTVTAPDGSQALALTPYFLESLLHAPAGSVEAAGIPVERINGPVLLLGGEDDLLWPSCYFQKVLMKRLEQTGHAAAHGDVSTCHPASGHNLPFVGGPTTQAMWQRMGTRWYALGGTAQGIARAQRAANEQLRAFLQASLGPGQ